MAEDSWCKYCNSCCKESGLTICETCEKVRRATLEEVKKRLRKDLDSCKEFCTNLPYHHIEYSEFKVKLEEYLDQLGEAKKHD